MIKPAIREDEYTVAVDEMMGWCSECKEFTRDNTESDAEEYDCPVCGNDTVTGAENALIDGLFEFSEPDYGDGHDFENLDSG